MGRRILSEASNLHVMQVLKFKSDFQLERAMHVNGRREASGSHRSLAIEPLPGSTSSFEAAR